MNQPSHLDRGRAVMVDISQKQETQRRAIASAIVRSRTDVIARLARGEIPKGDVLAAARIAGIMAAKKTSELIPLCHPLDLTTLTVDFKLAERTVTVTASAGTVGKTGVEMEALTAASIAALTLYDMCKSLDRAMVIEQVRLEQKEGGKTGTYSADPTSE